MIVKEMVALPKGLPAAVIQLAVTMSLTQTRL
jgi:hypothetical protein